MWVQKNARLQYLSSRGYLPSFMVFNTTLGSAECYQYTLWQAKCCFHSMQVWKLEKKYSELYLIVHISASMKTNLFSTRPEDILLFLFMNYTGSAYFSIFFILNLYFKSMDRVGIACKYLFDVFENS